MKITGLIGVVSYRCVAVAVGALVLSSGTAVGQDPPPSSVDLSAVIRDFSKDHPDFNRYPFDGYGYYAGNVAIDLDEDGKPVYTGAGFKIRRVWKDANGNVISPHLYNTCGFVWDDTVVEETGATSFRLTVDEKVKVEKHSVIDSFDSNVGPYGEENVGESAMVMVNGTNYHRRYVKVKRKSTIKGDVMVHPDDDPADAVKVYKRSEITGTIGNMETAAEIADFEMPVMELGESVGKVRYKGGEHVISENVHCDKLKLKRHAVVTVQGDVTIWCDRKLELDDGSVLNIEGNVTIWCDDKLELDDQSEIRLGEEASLTVYVGRKVEVDDKSMLNMNTGDPQLVTVYMLSRDEDDDDDDDDDGHHGESKFKVDDRSMVCAWVHGADTYLKVDDDSEFFGSFMGRKVEVKDRSRLHVDMATTGTTTVVVTPEEPPEECDLGDVAGSYLRPSMGDVASAGTFFEWWRDVLGVNMSTVQTIRLIRNKFDIYFFLSDDYRPIDGLLNGNEGEVHNYYLTVELDANFTYDASAGQWVEFRGTDDTYAFVNGKLVMDLGGYGYNKVIYVDMDRLGLTDGEACRFQLFHAQRQRGLGIFRLQTNIALADNAPSPSVNSILED